MACACGGEAGEAVDVSRYCREPDAVPRETALPCLAKGPPALACATVALPAAVPVFVPIPAWTGVVLVDPRTGDGSDVAVGA